MQLADFESDVRTEAAIRATRLTKRFGSQVVLRDCTLAVPTGSIVGLVGENGSGKTTLMQCLVGLLEPTEGSAEVLDEDSRQLSPATKARLGYVPQQTQLPPWLTAAEVCDYFGAFYPSWDPDHVESLAGRWRLPLDKPIRDLSGGQQQLASLVAAMGHRPEVLILDEPVVGLDPKARRDFLTVLHELGGEPDSVHDESPPLTVLFSTHLLSDLERSATHVALLKEGGIRLMTELSDLKESVLKLRITSPKPLPRPPLQSLAMRHDGETVVATVTAELETHWRQWAEEYDAVVLADRLNLEDLFVELS